MNNWTTLKLQTSVVRNIFKKLRSKATEGKVFIAQVTDKRFLNTFIFGKKKKQKNKCREEKCIKIEKALHREGIRVAKKPMKRYYVL